MTRMYDPDWDDDDREEGRRLNAEAKQEEFYRNYAPDPCDCNGVWILVGTDPTYGADADGRRGIMLREWACSKCDSTVEVLG